MYCLYVSNLWMTTDHSIESMSAQWVHNVAHVRLNQALLLQQHSTTAVTRGVTGGRRSFSSRQGVMRAGCGSRDNFYASQITAIVPRSTNRCKQSGDQFELANSRCLNEFRHSFWVYTENETENENATTFSAVNESDRNQHKLAFSAPKMKTKTKFGRTLGDGHTISYLPFQKEVKPHRLLQVVQMLQILYLNHSIQSHHIARKLITKL